MLFFAFILLVVILVVGFVDSEIVKLLLAAAWMALALMAIGAILYSLLGALF
jgi:hypothetical protein